MSKIFVIRNDGYHLPELDLEIDDIIDSIPNEVDENTVLDFSLTNQILQTWWPTPDTEFRGIGDEPFSEIPDLSKWIDATLVLSPKAHRYLGEFLIGFGELLPITVKGENFYIFNCLMFGAIQDSLCEKNYYDGEEIGIKSIVFDENDVRDKLLFKTPYNACYDLYCGEQFKDAVEKFGLTGVVFSETLINDFN